MPDKASLISVLMLGFLLPVISSLVQAADASRPNILLIIADDLGFTDMSSFGSEIQTPNLDQLAYDGLRLTSFYTAPNCSPTRSMLMSGTDNHIAGLGNMFEELAPNQQGHPGYEGYLNTRVASLADLLRDAGYRTYMSGKWHLGLEEHNSPAARGFDKSYAMLQGGAGHFDDLGLFFVNDGKAMYRQDGKPASYPKGAYSTEFYTNRMIEYINSDRGDDRPFFAYLSYTAVHWPLQAPQESIAKFKGKYDHGYDLLHEQRIKSAITKGVLPETSQVTPRLDGQPAWNDLSADKKRYEAKRMEIYAAMVHDLDVYVGKIINYLKEIGEYENTFILFMADNGAEGHDVGLGFYEDMDAWIEHCCNNSYENIGNADSYIFVGPNWTRASVGPFRVFKGFPSEGGIRVPAFIHYPGMEHRKGVFDGFMSVMDVMPTLLELAGTSHPGETYKGRKVAPTKGMSVMPLLANQSDTVHSEDYAMGWELFAKLAMRKGEWKAMLLPEPYGTGEWGLYNLRHDISERNDLSEEYPEKFRELVGLWNQYAEDNGVIIPNEVDGY